MEIGQYLNVVKKWWWLMVLSVVVAAAASFLATQSEPSIYASRITLRVGEVLISPDPSQNDLYTGQALAQAYADLATREPVLLGALQSLNLEGDWQELRTRVSVRTILGTPFLEIAVTDQDPELAKALTDAVANQLIQQTPAASDPERQQELQFIQTQIDDLKTNIDKARDEIVKLQDVLSNATSARQIQDARARQNALQDQMTTWRSTYAQLLAALQRGTPNSLSVVEASQVPTTPIGPNARSNIALAAAIGLVFAVGAAFLLEYVDDTIKTDNDVRQVLGLPTIGSIVRMGGKDYRSKTVTSKDFRTDVSEGYRLLRTNLQYAAVDKPLQTLMITSSTPLEGKSLTASNLASVMAQAGQQVILVDADLRRPILHRILGLDNYFGLTTLLVNRDVQLSQVLQPVPKVESLRVLTSGPIPPNPSDMLGSHRMSEIIEALTKEADLVIFDTPPVAAVSDSAILGQKLDHTLMVVQSGRTRKPVAKRCKEALSSLGIHIAGVCLNQLPRRQLPFYGGYNSYYHRQKSDSTKAATG